MYDPIPIVAFCLNTKNPGTLTVSSARQRNDSKGDTISVIQLQSLSFSFQLGCMAAEESLCSYANHQQT